MSLLPLPFRPVDPGSEALREKKVTRRNNSTKLEVDEQADLLEDERDGDLELDHNDDTEEPVKRCRWSGMR